ncbi:MAG: type I-MYXAN CRISPR-associated protein Cas6/Cmx6 [Gammaproteobacteria bacterium]
MFWSDEKDRKAEFVVSDDVVDLAFRIRCPTLPLDHAHSLSSALLRELPWLEKEEFAGVHLIHGAASGNGWYRPEDVPRHRLEDARQLVGKTLDIAGHPLALGETEVFLLSSLPTLFARYVITDADKSEEAFLVDVARQLEADGIACRKLLGGISHALKFPQGPVFTRSLMVADLEPEQSVRLQQIGVGEGRAMGCGLFLPHKGIKPVKENSE